ncbi:MAG TPA: SMI1/KNR4 family protein [Archangium sp.]|uniref:SMI1/KNR4 family protein n=1 Tax=Archangium sp. TaxID=1872627 RepID=UPI002E367058|nr:SMI1/KNR4 family protein [Archangium sp.]HEX5750049.1 SMI1/KNR4 family protein [Archangium sp.]
MNIRWEPYVWKESHPAAPAEIAELEAAWGVQLPEEYKQLAPQHQGMRPTPNVFDIGESDNAFTCLLTLSLEESKEGYAIPTRYSIIKPYVPSGIFPFGMTPGGESICFDYREVPPGQPRIVLVTTEMEVYLIANNFREFLTGLHELRD